MLETPPPSLRILVLDGHDRAALAAVRSLGRRRNRIAVASHAAHVPAFASRYCTERHTSPDPYTQRGGYVRWLIDSLQRGRFDALLCFDTATADVVSEYQSTQRHYTGCALPPRQAILDAGSPQRLRAHAGRLGVNAAILPMGSPPRLLRPSRSDRFYLLTALAREGEAVATFVQRELGGLRTPPLRMERLARPARERPWLSSHACAVSVEKPDVSRLGAAVLRALGWHGLATLAFRQDRRLGRLEWLGMYPGLLDGVELAITAGVDLPWLYVQLAAGRPVAGPTSYRLGLKYVRLWLGRAFRDSMVQTLANFGPDTCTHLCLSDPMPHLDALGRVVGWMRRPFAGDRQPDADISAPTVIVPFPVGRHAPS